MDQREAVDNTEPKLAADATDSTEANEPTEPIESTEPAEPMDRIDPAEPIDKIDPLEPMLRIEPDEPLPPALLTPEPLCPMLAIVASRPSGWPGPDCCIACLVTGHRVTGTATTAPAWRCRCVRWLGTRQCLSQ